MQTNISTNHGDIPLVFYRGLTVDDEKFGGLGVRGKGDSDLIKSVDNK